MLVKTEGIVVSHIKYKETSIICKILTKQYGVLSFIISGVRSKSGKFKIALFQPLTLLQLDFPYKENKGLLRLKEVKCISPILTSHTDYMKNCMALFMCEIIQKVSVYNSDDDSLYEMFNSIIKLLERIESKKAGILPIVLMVGLCRAQGFLPLEVSELKQQLKSSGTSSHISLSKEDETVLQEIINGQDISDLKSSKTLFYYLLDYYQANIGSLGELKSMTVVRELLS